jgi:hypothetical protein
MKKTLLLLLQFSMFVPLFGQTIPTITYEKYKTTAVPGDLINQSYYTLGDVVVNPGVSGANKTWDFTALTSFSLDNDKGKWVAPPTTGDYSSATHAYFIDGVGLDFTAYQSEDLFGVIDLGFEGKYFSTNFKTYGLSTLMTFPFTYQDSFKNSKHIFINEFGADVLVDTGRVSLWADGYGTLKTFKGTFNNVLRIKKVKKYTRNIGISTTIYDETNYTWYDVDNRAIFSTTKTVKDGTTITHSTTHYDVVPLTLPTQPFITIVGKTNICPNESVTLKAPDGFISYLWSNGATTQSITVTNAGSYSVIVKNSIGSSPSSSSISVLVVAAPTIVITGKTALCTGTSTTLTASGGTQYVWSNGSVNAQTIIVNATAPNNYKVTVTNTAGCKATKDVQVTIFPLPQLTASSTPNKESCEKSKVALSVLGATSYTWTGVGLTQTTGNNVNATIAVGQNTFNVEGKDANGCVNTASVSVTGLPLPQINAVASNQTPCADEKITLIAAGAKTYSWTGTGLPTTTGVSVNVTVVAGQNTFTVEGKDAKGCINTATILVNTSPAPQINAVASNPNPCIGDNISLIAIGANTYIWSSAIEGGLQNLTGSNVSAKPSKEGKITYSVIGNDIKGCKSAPFNLDVTVKNCTATNEQESENEIIIYPNPVSNRLFFTNIEKIASVTVFDALGKFIFTEKDIAQGIDVQSLPSEIYFLKINMNEGTVLTKKVVKIN